MSEATDIGFLGLGQMGSAMAERLLSKAWRVHVYDPQPDALAPFLAAGAVNHDSPAAVADVATVVFACLPNQAVSLDAAMGPRGVCHGRAVRLYGEMSTIGGETVERIAAGLSGRSIRVVDCPVTGGPPVARAGNLTVMVAADDDAVGTMAPMLSAIGRHVIRVGTRPGLAQRMKVINNIVMATNMVAACEGLAMGVKAGLDVDTMLGVLRVGTGQSFAGCELLRYAVSGAFDFGARLSIVAKDVALGRAEAGALEASLDVIDRGIATWTEANRTELADEDCTAIIKAVERRNGVLVRS